MPQPAFFSINIDVAKERAGSAQGVTSSCLSLAGIMAPLMTGWLIDLTGNYQGAFLLLGRTDWDRGDHGHPVPPSRPTLV